MIAPFMTPTKLQRGTITRDLRLHCMRAVSEQTSTESEALFVKAGQQGRRRREMPDLFQFCPQTDRTSRDAAR
jgi:hypothetical protein